MIGYKVLADLERVIRGTSFRGLSTTLNKKLSVTYPLKYLPALS